VFGQQKNVHINMLTAEEIKMIDHEISLVPYRKAAGIEALKIVQQNRGWISDEALHEVAEYMDMSDEELDSIATFYNLIFRKPVGKHIVLICDSISCYVMGCNQLYENVKKLLNIKYGETTADKIFTLLPNACLGCCDRAPALMVDSNLYTDVKEEMLENIFQKYE